MSDGNYTVDDLFIGGFRYALTAQHMFSHGNAGSCAVRQRDDQLLGSRDCNDGTDKRLIFGRGQTDTASEIRSHGFTSS